MKRYWDYDEKERAEMTMEQVEGLLSAELMEAGVIRVEAPTLLPTEAPEIPGTILYVIKAGYQTPNFAYKTADDAAKAMEKAIPLGHDYLGNGTYIYTESKSASEGLTIEPLPIHTKGDVANHKSLVERAAANAKANEAANKTYTESCKAVSDVTDRVWVDWNNCRATLGTYQRIMRTLDEYTETCEGNRDTALKFLAKAFPQPDIDQAREWLDPDYVAETAAIPEYEAVIAMAP
jgi:hypothetical protein